MQKLVYNESYYNFLSDKWSASARYTFSTKSQAKLLPPEVKH